jgi:hypothetical protein
MSRRALQLFIVILLPFLACSLVAHSSGSQQDSPHRPLLQVPRMWDDEAMASLEVPLADPSGSPHHVPADYYYRIPIRPIYKSYPVYAPGKEPSGYMDKLSQYEPEVDFDPALLHTEQDWVKAGELVFDAPSAFLPLGVFFNVRDPEWNKLVGMPQAKDGTIPYFRYVIREKGKVELGPSPAACVTPA